MADVIQGRQPGESLAQYRGRLRRENNDRVDALGLKEGDPVVWNGTHTRFKPVIMTRTNLKYQQIRRLTAAETKVMEAKEREREEHYARQRESQAKREAFEARPEVRAASTVMYALENDMPKYIDRLTPAEWEALAAKLT